MKKKLKNNKMKHLLLTVMLIVAMAFTVIGCGKQETSSPSGETTDVQTKELGEGQTKIQFIVVDKDGNETQFVIHTDKELVGDALLEHDLIAGEEGPYGLYVTQVNGITADYDADKTYWAFYVNGEYATAGVDATPVKEGETYTFKVEK